MTRIRLSFPDFSIHSNRIRLCVKRPMRDINHAFHCLAISTSVSAIIYSHGKDHQYNKKGGFIVMVLLYYTFYVVLVC